MTPSQVEVTQADRDAAADLVCPNGRLPGFPSDFRSGRADQNELTQAFAAHRARFEEQTRTATEREVVGRAAAVIDELARAETRAIKHADDPVTKGRCAVIAAEFRRAAKFIRALSEQKS